jgi:hypothetical protein
MSTVGQWLVLRCGWRCGYQIKTVKVLANVHVLNMIKVLTIIAYFYLRDPKSQRWVGSL